MDDFRQEVLSLKIEDLSFEEEYRPITCLKYLVQVIHWYDRTVHEKSCTKERDME